MQWEVNKLIIYIAYMSVTRKTKFAVTWRYNPGLVTAILDRLLINVYDLFSPSKIQKGIVNSLRFLLFICLCLSSYNGSLLFLVNVGLEMDLGILTIFHSPRNILGDRRTFVLFLSLNHF
jgi:hypothetical protein